MRVGQPPIVVLDREQQLLEGPAITADEAKQLLQSIADTRQRRELREHGQAEFIYRFRDRANFVICARTVNEEIQIDVH